MVEVALLQELFGEIFKYLEDVLLNSSLKLRKGKFKSRKLLPAASLSYVEPVIAQDKINKKSDSFRWLVM